MKEKIGTRKERRIATGQRRDDSKDTYLSSKPKNYNSQLFQHKKRK